MISIVMAYFNRKPLLINTLRSLCNSKYDGDLEVIIVDDASTNGESLEGLPSLFPRLNIKVYTVKREKKWWINPCIPFNIGFSLASGDKIIIQNPECMHMGDILSEVSKQTVGEYKVFGSYSVGPVMTDSINKLHSIADKDFVDMVHKIIRPTVDVRVELARGYEKWYQHSMYNPGAINFCCSIMKSDLDVIGGFDERFAKGIAYDDREFIVRIRKMGLFVNQIDNPFVVHQCHGYTDYSNSVLVKRNEDLLREVTSSAEYKANNLLSDKLKYEVLI